MWVSRRERNIMMMQNVMVGTSRERVECWTLDNVVPIFPVQNSFEYKTITIRNISINKEQLPLLPAYTFTDY